MTIKKNIEISVESSTRKVFFEDNFLGLTGENLQGYVVFSFKDKFVSGVPRVEIVQGSNKYIITDMETDTENETYKLLIKSSLLTTSNVQMQLVITESGEQDSIPIFKSKMFSLYVAESINAETTIPEEYAAWIDTANAKIAEINEKLEDVDTALENVDTAIQNAETATSGAENVNISSSKSGKTTTVVTTNRNGVETTNEVLDGNDGEDGEDGIGLQFMWQGTSLGIKRENDSEYQFVDLQGIQGNPGPQGDPFRIKKTYSSVSEMNADFNNMNYGDYVMIASSVEEEDNAKLYTRGEYEWIFITDFSGATGIRGQTGLTPSIQIGTVETGNTSSVTRTGTDENPVLNFVLEKGASVTSATINANGELVLTVE